jgi:hypothetical protein
MQKGLPSRLSVLSVKGAEHVAENRCLHKQGGCLKGPADPFSGNLICPEGGDFLPGKDHFALIWRMETADKVKQGRFARTIGADQTRDFPIINREAHIVYRGKTAEILLEIPDFQ